MHAGEPSLTVLKEQMKRAGATVLLAKELAPNDNSKNQIYLGGGFHALGLFPVGPVRADATDEGGETLKAPLPLWWVLADGSLAEAPNAQLILYPQYPEVRLSGVLLGSRNAPAALVRCREPGRVFFFGITADRRTLGCVASPSSRLAAEYRALPLLEVAGVFSKIPLDDPSVSSRQRLLSELKRVHEAGWIESRGLNSDGTFRPCNSMNCVGYTLEAELGIARNGYSEPDFLGWEVKAGQVSTFASIAPAKAMTLLTPEPDAGFYAEEGPQAFVRRFGYPDRRGRPDRLNFGGVFKSGIRHPLTRLTLQLTGYDRRAGKITDPKGAIVLRDDRGSTAAAWSYAKLANHWNRKHAQAVYVPAECRVTPSRQYRYGSVVRLGEGTDFLMLLKAVAEGAVFYDPAIKVEEASGNAPKLKRRSQFRIASGALAMLYQQMSRVEVRSGELLD